MGRLSDSERKAIIEKMRAVESQHAQAGVSASSRIICHNCGHARPLRGAVRYDRYRLCNDCALRYELALAEGDVKTIEDFVLALGIRPEEPESEPQSRSLLARLRKRLGF